MDELLEKTIEECAAFSKKGKVASYIPELEKANPADFGIAILSSDGRFSRAGDCHKRFTIQSIVKPVLLLQALLDNGVEYVRAHVGVEATGKPFDAINYTEQSLLSDHINPMVNMGAIAMCTMIGGGSYEEKFRRLLDLTRRLAGNDSIELDERVYLSEKRTGNKNRALAYLLKTYNMIEDDVEEVLDCYFRACSIQVDCVDLAHIGFTLANHGRRMREEERIFPAEYASYVNAILMTCGMYDGSGDFAVKVGVPAKSGVGGGIMAVVPTRMGIGIFSPALDEKGNSIAGIRALETLSRKLYLSIF
ncbi:MAG: glutaminase A [Oscillospiraceae bacterium]|nr:glutaminase A [Oscillospiraceae bacterium]